MRSFLFVLFFSALAFESLGCGVVYRSNRAMFYPLFRQDELGPKAYADFLRGSYSEKFYGRASFMKNPYSQNVRRWQEFLGSGFSKENIQKVLKSEGTKLLEKEWDEEKPKERASADYIRYARSCSETFAYRASRSWDYGDILEEAKKRSIDSLIQEGYKGFEEVGFDHLKARYAYQIVRALHYSGRYEEAVDFFEEKVESEMEKDEVYYYIMDQAAGCYYSLRNYEEAAYRFLRVFGKSQDRKRSAYVSYEFCLNEGHDGGSMFQGPEDRGIHTTIKALRRVQHGPESIVDLYEIDPSAEDRLRLLFTRTMFDLERSVWPKRVGRSKDTLPHFEERQLRRVQKLDSICEVLKEDPKMAAPEYWALASSYIQFLKGDMEKARERLQKIEGKRYEAQQKMLGLIYEVFSWGRMDRKKEERLVDILQEDLVEFPFGADPNLNLADRYPDNGHRLWRPAWKYLLLDHVAHLYYRKGDLAKAFLTHNDLRSTHDLDAHLLVDRLIEFFEKEKKSPFEKVLVDWNRESAKGDAPIAHLRYVKGSYYLKEAAPEKALAEFDKADRQLRKEGKTDEFHRWKISGRVFSNNIKECFNCPEEEVMTDSVFIHDAYPFLKDELMGFEEIASSLIKLDSMSSNAVEWKQKLAHYLKGNFYYNVTTSGYYRGSLAGKGNCCNYEHGERPERYREILSERPGYNLYGLEAPSLYHGLAKEAFHEYERVLELSDDPELNARTLYMMAKCELNVMYSEEDLNWDEYYSSGKLTDKTFPYKESFERLHRNYSDTRFYDEIIERCAFFEHYVAERY
jgi:tetratricopeptide (TPR) repeat protein